MGMVLALNYLESTLQPRAIRSTILSDTADASLIFAGLFPERARRLHVSDDYFITICKMCLRELAEICTEMKKHGEAELYREIGDKAEDIAIVMYHGKNSNSSVVVFRDTIQGKMFLN